MRVSDLLEDSAGNKLAINKCILSAQAPVNKAPSGDEIGTWDLVLYNNKDDVTITIPEFFTYTYSQAKTPGAPREWFLKTRFGDQSDISRPTQGKPFPGGIFEKDVIAKVCKDLESNKASVKRVADIEDANNALGAK